MSESNKEPEAQPSTSQNDDTKKTAVIPLVSMPKVVLTRLDLNNLPTLVKKSPPSPAKKTLKRLPEKKNDSTVPKKVPVKTPTNIEQERSQRFRGRPRKDYKKLANLGSWDNLGDEETKTTTNSGKVSSIAKKALKSKSIEEDNSVKGMLKKTMLQKKSKIAIPPPKKPKLMSSKENLSSSKLKKDLTKAVSPKINKDVSSILKNTISQMDTDASEDEFLYDELIDELVNPPNKKPQGTEKTTNITLKPNIGNKPPTIVKGGIVKKSSLPPDLKSVSSPTTLNSSKLTGSLLNSKVKSTTAENTIKSPATAETPKASLPTKASPFPISLGSSPTKNETKGIRGPNKSVNEVTKNAQPLNLNTPASAQSTQKPKSVTPAPRPKGRPRIGPKQTIMTSPVISTVADDESDEYTEIETLEPDPEPLELLPKNIHKSNDILVTAQDNSNASNDLSADRPETDPTKDTDPHLDLLRILTGETEEPQDDSMISKEKSENPHGSSSEAAKKHEITTSSNNPNTSSSERSINDTDTKNTKKEDNTFPAFLTDDTIKQPVHHEEKNSKVNQVSGPSVETAIEETPPVRTVYDLMNDVSLKYPSWNLHIIPETNAFCIAQVTKGRLGLPTLKKCIELDAETYCAKVYIHQYHIKRFDGVYDSEEAILALIEEIHSIKA